MSAEFLVAVGRQLAWQPEQGELRSGLLEEATAIREEASALLEESSSRDGVEIRLRRLTEAADTVMQIAGRLSIPASDGREA